MIRRNIKVIKNNEINHSLIKISACTFNGVTLRAASSFFCGFRIKRRKEIIYSRRKSKCPV